MKEKTFQMQDMWCWHIASVHEEGKCSATTVVVVLQKRGNLKNHIEVVHEGKKPFKCIICDSSFTWNSHLKGHIPSVH